MTCALGDLAERSVPAGGRVYSSRITSFRPLDASYVLVVEVGYRACQDGSYASGAQATFRVVGSSDPARCLGKIGSITAY